MTSRLSDTRDVATIQDAEALMSRIRAATCERDIIIARAEKRIAAITAESIAATAPLDEQIEAAEQRLAGYILGHRDQFVKPRTHRNPDGEFGLRTATRLEITDEDALIEHILDNGYDDCIKIKRSLVKAAITKRLEKEKLLGARLDTGEIAFCKVNSALVKQEVDNAIGS